MTSAPARHRDTSVDRADASPDRVTVEAWAKINVTLTVVGRRSDGFHEIDTLFSTVAVHDTVTVSIADGRTVTGTTDTDASSVGEVAPPMDPRNLAWLAATAWHGVDASAPGFHVALVKRLPVAAGLGGGSSDAAATLRAIATLRPGAADPVALAASLGSDVPFFAAGHAAAWGTGRGEILEPVILTPRPVVLLNLGESVPVKTAYDAWFAERGRHATTSTEDDRDAVREAHERIVRAWNAGNDLPAGNDLEPGIAGRHPGVAASLAALRDVRLTCVRMSGSGATCFGLAEDEAHARRAASVLAKRHPRAWVASSMAPGPT